MTSLPLAHSSLTHEALLSELACFGADEVGVRARGSFENAVLWSNRFDQFVAHARVGCAWVPHHASATDHKRLAIDIVGNTSTSFVDHPMFIIRV